MSFSFKGIACKALFFVMFSSVAYAATSSGFDSTSNTNIFAVNGQLAITLNADLTPNANPPHPSVIISGPITEGNTTIETDGTTTIGSNTGNPDPLFVNGRVGIGTNAPGVALDVVGAIRPGSSVAVTACGIGAANGEGSQRYNYTTHEMEYCNGTTWVSAPANSPTTTKIVTGNVVCRKGNGDNGSGSTAQCPAGYVVVGGGMTMTGDCECGETYRFTVESHPTADGTGWNGWQECATSYATAVCVLGTVTP